MEADRKVTIALIESLGTNGQQRNNEKMQMLHKRLRRLGKESKEGVAKIGA